MKRKIAKVQLSCGRYFLSVCGFVLAMEGAPCRESQIPEKFMPKIPPEEMAWASVGGKPASELPIEVVRFFRGDNWTREMLNYVADEINKRIATPGATDAG